MSTPPQVHQGQTVPVSLEDQLREGRYLSQSRFRSLLGIDVEAVVQAAPAAPHCDSAQAQAYMRASLRVLAAAVHVCGDFDKALAWFKNEPLGEFDGRTAEALVAHGLAKELVSLLEMYEAGHAG